MKRTLLLVTLLCAAAVARGGAQSARLPVSVIVTTTADAAPFFYAQQQGLFEKAGLDVTAMIVASGSIATAAVIGGSAQVAQSNIFTVVLAHARRIPLVLIAPGGQNNPASPNLDLFVLRDGPIKTAKDLDGRTLGVTSVHDQQSLGARALIEAAG
jgi:NitT/TauT family transport system substrate-binding protein